MSDGIKPNLGYRDARAAIRFLVDALGFEEIAVYDQADDDVGHAELRWPGGGVVALHSAAPGGASVAELAPRAAAGDGYPAFTVNLETDSPDAVYARAVAAAATVVRELQDSPFGTRGFIVRDPEGLYWSVATPLPELVRDPDGNWRPEPDR